MKKICFFLFFITTHLLFAQEFNGLQIWSGNHHNEHSLFGVNACHIKNQDEHAPVGLMSFHNHPVKNMMFSYKFMNMNMEGMYFEDQPISLSNVFENYNYMVVPIKMNMDMHMLGMMYSFSDRFGISVMAHWLRKNMNLVSRMGMQFQTKSSGIGDVKIGGLYEVIRKRQKQFFLGANLSIPTGSIEKRDDTPMMENVKLPYAMQLGAGSFMGELLAVLSIKKRNWSYGFQQKTTTAIGKNKWDYRLGNGLETNGWLIYLHNDRWSFSGRINWKRMDNIIGRDPQLNPMMIVTADTQNTGGQIVKGFLGVNFFPVLNQNAQGVKLAVEYNFPIYQKWNLLHISRKEGIQVGVSWVFGP